VNLKISASNIGAFQMVFKTRIDNFLENGFNDFDRISTMYEDCIRTFSGKRRYAHEGLKYEMSVFTEPTLLVRRISFLFVNQKPTMVYTNNRDCVYKTE
jgi:hypothetical protein